MMARLKIRDYTGKTLRVAEATGMPTKASIMKEGSVATTINIRGLGKIPDIIDLMNITGINLMLKGMVVLLERGMIIGRGTTIRTATATKIEVSIVGTTRKTTITLTTTSVNVGKSISSRVIQNLAVVKTLKQKISLGHINLPKIRLTSRIKKLKILKTKKPSTKR